MLNCGWNVRFLGLFEALPVPLNTNMKTSLQPASLTVGDIIISYTFLQNSKLHVVYIVPWWPVILIVILLSLADIVIH